MELSREEAYAKSEEIYSEIRKEVEEFLKQIKPKIKILENFANEHKLIVENPLILDGHLDGAQHYVGKDFSSVPEKQKNVGWDSEFYFLDEKCKEYDGRWVSSSDFC